MLKLDGKTYRIETILIEEKNPNYFIQKKYARNIEIYYLGRERKDEHHRFQLLIVDFDFSEDTNSMGKLTKQISYLFDELDLIVDNDGTIVKVDNINFLRIRWVNIQAQLSEKHRGDAIERYFSQISELLENQEKLINFLEGYNMFGLLFHGLWRSFDVKCKRLSENNITEIMTPKKVGDKIIQNILPESLENTDIVTFRGFYQYKENIYEEGFIEIKKETDHFKYSLLWVT